MTPEELLRNVIFRIIDANSLTGTSLEETRQIFEAIQQAKSEWCKQQREICASSYADLLELDPVKNFNAILNAPEP